VYAIVRRVFIAKTIVIKLARKNIMKEYTVEGMTCQGCVRALTKALETGGANNICIVLEGGKVSLQGLDASEVQSIVEDAGFDFMGALA